MLIRSFDFTKVLTMSLTKSILGLGMAEYKTLSGKDVFLKIHQYNLTVNAIHRC